MQSLRRVRVKLGFIKGYLVVYPQEAEIYARSLTTVNELEAAFGALWTQCQRCQGSLHQVHPRARCIQTHRKQSELVLPGELFRMRVCAPW